MGPVCIWPGEERELRYDLRQIRKAVDNYKDAALRTVIDD
jgi:hypothetical protein